MPTSWFHKLRRNGGASRSQSDDSTSRSAGKPRNGGEQPPPMAPARSAPPCSPKRASYYYPSRDGHHPDVFQEMPELKLRPIVTRPAKNGPSDIGGGSSAATAGAVSPVIRARRFHVRQTRRRTGTAVAAAAVLRGGLRRARRWLYESVVLVKEAANPEEEFLESMAEMIVENDVRSSDDLEELLACYLALNAAEHHRTIAAAFQRLWYDLANQRLQD